MEEFTRPSKKTKQKKATWKPRAAQQEASKGWMEARSLSRSLALSPPVSPLSLMFCLFVCLPIVCLPSWPSVREEEGGAVSPRMAVGTKGSAGRRRGAGQRKEEDKIS